MTLNSIWSSHPGLQSHAILLPLLQPPSPSSPPSAHVPGLRPAALELLVMLSVSSPQKHGFLFSLPPRPSPHSSLIFVLPVSAWSFLPTTLLPRLLLLAISTFCFFFLYKIDCHLWLDLCPSGRRRKTIKIKLINANCFPAMTLICN